MGHCSGHKQYTGGVYSLLIVVAANLYIDIYIIYLYYNILVATNSTPHRCPRKKEFVCNHFLRLEEGATHMIVHKIVVGILLLLL